MEEFLHPQEPTAPEAYDPEDEYTLPEPSGSETAEQAAPAEAQPAEQAQSPAPPTAPYPQAPPYPAYPPVYGAPYPPQPVQAPPQPYYPVYTPPFYPQAGAVPPYPVQPYPYPPQPIPPVQPVQSVQPMQTAPVVQPAPCSAPAASSDAPDAEAAESDKAPKPPKKPVTPLGTKIYLIVLTALMVALVAGFAIYVAKVADREKTALSPSGSSDSSGSDLEDRLRDLLKDNSDGSGFDKNSAETEEFDAEITLVEDKGDTQKRSDDNEDSVGTPDPSAKSITLSAIPKDKDDAKYTAQSAYESVCNSVVTVELYDGSIDDSTKLVGMGTGTVISADGYLITNAHVVKNSRLYAVKIIMNSGETYQAKIIGYDTWSDLAVLKIDAKGLTPVVFGDSALIEIGQDVVAIGSPGGEKFQNSLTKGIVSAVDRELSINQYVRYIQSDAAISPGNSGGPLCNIYGQVIGINTAKSTATNYEAMTFSIPSDTVQEIVNELLHYGYVRGRARIGFAGNEVSSESQYYYGMPAGVIIGEIDSTGALAGTDIRENDIITAIDGKQISTFQDIYAILSEHKAGDTLTLSIYRIKE